MTLDPTDLDADRLGTLYDPPAERIQKAVTSRLTGFHRDYLAAATFFVLATGGPRGQDASPRGGPAGFVKVLDDHHVVFADWPGNNRIESMRNLLEDDRLGMLFLFPGLELFMRINGRGRLSEDPALLDLAVEGGRRPKAATLVEVEEALFHCGKAVNRARLWAPEARIDRRALPSVGAMLKSLAEMPEVSEEALTAHYDEAVKRDLY